MKIQSRCTVLRRLFSWETLWFSKVYQDIQRQSFLVLRSESNDDFVSTWNSENKYWIHLYSSLKLFSFPSRILRTNPFGGNPFCFAKVNSVCRSLNILVHSEQNPQMKQGSVEISKFSFDFEESCYSLVRKKMEIFRLWFGSHRLCAQSVMRESPDHVVSFIVHVYFDFIYSSCVLHGFDLCGIISGKIIRHLAHLKHMASGKPGHWEENYRLSERIINNISNRDSKIMISHLEQLQRRTVLIHVLSNCVWVLIKICVRRILFSKLSGCVRHLQLIRDKN